MSVATITSKHQITIPKDVRERMNLCEGDQVEFEPSPSGKVVLRKRNDLQRSDGAAVKFIKRKKRLSIEEIKAAARDGAVKSFKGRGS